MEIRKAIPKDEKEISEMYYQLYPNFKGPKNLISTNKITAKVLSFVAEDGGEVVGFIIGTFIMYGASKYGYLEELYVKEAFRRKGIGGQLINRILDEYKKLETWALFVMTKETDAIAQAFYNKMGFMKSKGLWLYKEL
ncbi:MAG: GNAT family N-acetyltransferase [Patescibacteria group bacterium]